MPVAGKHPHARANAHVRWAQRYNEENDSVRAAAHLRRAMEYQAFGPGGVAAPTVAALSGAVSSIATSVAAVVPLSLFSRGPNPTPQSGPVVDFTGKDVPPSPVAPHLPITQAPSRWTEFKERIREDAHMDSDPMTWTDIIPPLALGLTPLALGSTVEEAREYLKRRREGRGVDRRTAAVAELASSAVAA